MNTAQLASYLETAVYLEKADYFLEWALLRCHSERLAQRRETRFQEPTEPREPENPLPGILARLLGGFAISVAAALIAFVALFGWGFGCVVGTCLGIFLGLTFVLTSYFFGEKDKIEDWGKQKTGRKAKEIRQDAFARYAQQKLEHPLKSITNVPAAARAAAREAVLTEMIDQLNQEKTANKAALEAHYAQGVLYPKYRRFSMVCCLHEYIQSGRRDKLEGPQGAYELLEEELQQRKIVSELNDLDWKSAQVRQYGVYAAMQEVITRAAALAAEIDRRVEAYLEAQREA